MKNKKEICKGLFVWEWGFSFNEAGMFSRYIPLVISIGIPGMRFYMYLGFPFLKYGVHPDKDWNTKELYYRPIKLFRIIIK